MKVPIDEIVVNKRIREDVGDLSDLIDSISRHGLLNPISITEDRVLLAGFRRLEACRILGYNSIDCTVVNAQSPLQKLLIEFEENKVRKDFNADEVIKFEEEKRFLAARGVVKFILWIRRIFRRILAWIKTALSRGSRS